MILPAVYDIHKPYTHYIQCHDFFSFLQPERLYLVPSLLAFLVSQDAVKPEYLESVQDIVVGAAPCTNSLLEKFREKFSYPDLLVRQGNVSEKYTYLCIRHTFVYIHLICNENFKYEPYNDSF